MWESVRDLGELDYVALEQVAELLADETGDEQALVVVGKPVSTLSEVNRSLRNAQNGAYMARTAGIREHVVFMDDFSAYQLLRENVGRDSMTRFSIPENELRSLPPAFLTASTADQDVPFSFSKKLSLQIPKSRFLPVFGLEHDYDRNPELPESRQLDQSALDWTDSLL